MSIKNSNDTIGNRTRDLPACSAVPQPTAPPRTPPRDRPIKWKTTFVVKNTSASAGATRKASVGLGAGMGKGFTRSWGKYERRPRFFIVQYRTATYGQGWVEYLVRDLYLPKTKAQLLGSRLQQRNLLKEGMEVSFYRKRQSNIYSTFRWMAIWCTAKTSVCWWKNFRFNMPLNGRGSLSIHLFWRQF